MLPSISSITKNGLYILIHWPKGPHRPPPNIIGNCQCYWLPSTTWWQDLILMVPYTYLCHRHGEIYLVLSWKLYLHWLLFIVTEGAIRGEKSLSFSPNYEPCSLQKWSVCKVCPLVQQWYEFWGSNQSLLIRFKPYFMRWNPYLPPLKQPRTWA